MPHLWNRIRSVRSWWFVCALTAGILGFYWMSARSEAADSALGKVIYERNCASCHGRNGKGLGDLSPTPDFTNKTLMATRSDEELYEKITNGGKGTGMPAWRSRLNDQERRDVIAYIRTFSR